MDFAQVEVLLSVKLDIYTIYRRVKSPPRKRGRKGREDDGWWFV